MSELRRDAGGSAFFGQAGATDAARAEEIVFDLGGARLRLLRVADIDRHVERNALLAGDAAPEPPYWMHLWPGARVLARALYEAPCLGAATRLIELGCGLGLPALAAARRGARVVASDREHEPLRLVARSARRNGLRLAAVCMDWTRVALRAGFDVCCGADVAYDRDAEAGLVEAARALLRPGGLLLLADSVNTYRRSLPPLLRERGFAVEEREVGEIDDGRNVWVRLLQGRRTG